MKTARLLISILAGLVLTACTSGTIEVPEPIPSSEPTAANQPSPSPTTDYSDLKIITLLPKDAIPAIDNPEFLPISEADLQYTPDELVIGVEFNGDSRAYSISHLSRHEIVNDTVGGVALSVTW